MTKYYTQKINCVLSDGTKKTYTYVKEYVSQKKETYFDKLLSYDEVKNIIKDNSLRSPEKLNMIKNFVKDKDEFNGMTIAQLRNFVYRIVETRVANCYDVLLGCVEVKKILKDNIPNTERMSALKEFVKDKPEFKNLTPLQLRNFIYRNQETKGVKCSDMLLKRDEVKDILSNNSVKNSEKVNMLNDFIKDKPEFKKLTSSQITNFVYRNSETKPVKYSDMLLGCVEVKDIIKNDGLRNFEKVNMIMDFIKDKPELKDLTKSQIKYVCKKQNSNHVPYFNMLLSYDEVKDILKDNIRNSDKLDALKRFIEDKPEFEGLSYSQLINFVYRITKKNENVQTMTKTNNKPTKP